MATAHQCSLPPCGGEPQSIATAQPESEVRLLFQAIVLLTSCIVQLPDGKAMMGRADGWQRRANGGGNQLYASRWRPISDREGEYRTITCRAVANGDGGRLRRNRDRCSAGWSRPLSLLSAPLGLLACCAVCFARRKLDSPTSFVRSLQAFAAGLRWTRLESWQHQSSRNHDHGRARFRLRGGRLALSRACMSRRARAPVRQRRSARYLKGILRIHLCLQYRRNPTHPRPRPPPRMRFPRIVHPPPIHRIPQLL